MKKIVKTFILLSFTAFLISSASWISNNFGTEIGVSAWFAALTGIFLAVYKLIYSEE